MRVAVLLALVLALAACGGQEETAQPETTQPGTTQPETTQPAPPQTTQPAPPQTTQPAPPQTTEPPTTTAAEPSAVAGTTLDGEPISLDDFRGKPVFVNVWSSW